MRRADAGGELQRGQRAWRRTTTTAPSSADSVEAARRDVVVGEIPEGTTDGALQHEAVKASGVVAVGDGGLHSVGDRVDHGVHGRYGCCLLVPWVEMQLRRQSTGELPPSCLRTPIRVSCG